jgi:hypothetical protein
MSDFKDWQGIAHRLGQLIRLLASDKDGEVLAAARAISRVLNSVGLSFHELAILIEEAITPAAPADPMERAAGPDQCTAVDILAKHFGRLTDWDRKFLRDIAHWRGALTPKQRAKLEEIVQRVHSGPWGAAA